MIDLRKKYDELFIEKSLLLQEKRSKKKELTKIKEKIKIYSMAHFLLIEVSKEIQKNFKKRVEVITTNAIQSIYDYPYIFELQFENKRNNIEVKPVIKKGGTILTPKDDMGGGILDVISFSLKIILWHLESPQTRKILFLDEPFKFLGSYTSKAGFMLRYLSKYFGLQIIITSHDPNLIEFCDKIYKVNYNGVESTVIRQIKRR